MNPLQEARELVVFASAAHAAGADHESDPIRVAPYRGCILIWNTTVFDLMGQNTLYLEGYDPAADLWYKLLDVNQGDTGTQHVCVYPGLIDSESAFNAVQGTPLPATIRVRIEADASYGSTYSVGMVLIP